MDGRVDSWSPEEIFLHQQTKNSSVNINSLIERAAMYSSILGGNLQLPCPRIFDSHMLLLATGGSVMWACFKQSPYWCVEWLVCWLIGFRDSSCFRSSSMSRHCGILFNTVTFSMEEQEGTQTNWFSDHRALDSSHKEYLHLYYNNC